VVPNVVLAQAPSIAFDSNNKPWIGYYDTTTLRYYAVSNSSTDGSGTWSKYTFPMAANAAGTATAIHDTAMAMSYDSLGVASPVMIILNSSGTPAGQSGARAARLTPSTNAWSTVRSLGAIGAGFGNRLVADFDTSGKIVVAYYDNTANSVSYNSSTNGTTWGTIGTISAVNAREGLSIRLNPATGNPAISFYNRVVGTGRGNLSFSYCTTAFASCNLGVGSWSVSVGIADTGAGLGLANTNIPTQNEQVLNSVLTFSPAGIPSITHLNNSSAPAQSINLFNGLSGTTIAGGTAETLQGVSYAEPLLGTSPNLFSGAAVGLGASGLRNSLGQLFTAYVGPNNWLYANTCE
jgi:hypothetical protein